MSAASEIIIPAIAEDGSLFPIEKMEAHRTDQQHLAISVFVFSGSKLLIQQRSASKYHCPGKWANTCCSHPHWGETVEHAATRRIGEELGIAVPLNKTSVFEYRADVGAGLIENERVHVFAGHADEATLALNLNAEEVSATRWVEVSELSALLAQQPDDICPWFAIYISNWDELKLGR
ncbi:MAG: isopentenyl-diphosphate Delta-isomerase [Pseudomonadota bacterium]